MLNKILTNKDLVPQGSHHRGNFHLSRHELLLFSCHTHKHVLANQVKQESSKKPHPLNTNLLQILQQNLKQVCCDRVTIKTVVFILLIIVSRLEAPYGRETAGYNWNKEINWRFRILSIDPVVRESSAVWHSEVRLVYNGVRFPKQ